MGVTIHYRLGQKKEDVKSTLDIAQVVAEEIKKNEADKLGIEFEIIRLTLENLLITIGGCESLRFDFRSAKEINSNKDCGNDYLRDVLFGKIGMGTRNPKLYFTAGFCKTQYATNIIEHKWVADIIKVVASRCRIVNVNDEGDYYHTAKMRDAKESIIENEITIDKIGSMLGGLGYKNDRIVKGETKIEETIKSKEKGTKATRKERVDTFAKSFIKELKKLTEEQKVTEEAKDITVDERNAITSKVFSILGENHMAFFVKSKLGDIYHR